MNSEPEIPEIDDYIARELAVEPIADAGFSNIAIAKLHRARRRRRALLAAGWTVSIATTLGLILAVPDAAPSVTVAPLTIAGAMVLAAICATIWIETESRSVA